MSVSTGKAARRQSGLNKAALKKASRVKREQKKYNDFVMTRDRYNAQKLSV